MVSVRSARRRVATAVSAAFAVVATLALVLDPAPAAAQQGGDGGPLTVGTKVAPPFVVRDANGNLTGPSIALWQRIAAGLGRDFRLEERSLDGLLAGAADGSLDAAVAAITATPAREERVDFTHPFYTTGLGIAVRAGESGGWWQTIAKFASWEFLSALAALALVLFGTGVAIWIFEHRHNDEFRARLRDGLWDGFWWSAVTMTTVGYGDKAPRTLPGKIVGLLWMFIAIIIISSFTAAITSSLTVERLSGPVKGVDDLPKVRVGAVTGSTGAGYLGATNVGARGFATVEAAMDALATGTLDAVVHDAPLLKYIARNRGDAGLAVLPETFDRQDYAIALPPGSTLREPVNRLILEHTRSRWWKETLERTLGPGG